MSNEGGPLRLRGVSSSEPTGLDLVTQLPEDSKLTQNPVTSAAVAEGLTAVQ